jgi:hypothetical protein
MKAKTYVHLLKGSTFRIKTGLILFISILYFQSSSAQVKIGTNPNQVQPSSLLELESQTKGLLLPRLADTLSINALNPLDGMLIYLEKTPNNGLYVRRNSGWRFLTGVTSSGGGGGAGFDPSTLNLASIAGKVDPATQIAATSGAVTGQVLTWNGTGWEPKSILQVSTTIVEKAKEFNTASGSNVIIEANSTNVVKVPVSGASMGDIVFVALIGDTPDFSVYNAWVSATNEVSIRFANYQPDPVTIIGTQYKVLLMK